MKINGTPPINPSKPVTSTANESREASKATSALAGTASSSNEAVRLSPEYANITKALKGDAPFDAEKVTKIKKAVDDGTFEISPEEIADAMIENAVSLLSKKSA